MLKFLSLFVKDLHRASLDSILLNLSIRLCNGFIVVAVLMAH